MKVLIVTDDLVLRALLAEVVFGRGHEVTAVRSAETAWARWEQEPFPLVLLDWQLPGINSLELALRIRTAEEGDASLILVLAGSIERQELSDFLDAGVNDYLAKPVEVSALSARLAIAERQVEYVGQRKRAEATLAHQALYDALTNLPNRILLHDRLNQAILGVQRSHESLAVLMMDLDRFKEVNDTFGHHFGDLLLSQVAGRLQASLRATDTVARLGGDEFAVLLPSAGDAAEAISAAHKILEALEEPFIIEHQALDARGSIGIALCPVHGEDAETLLRHADIAMYIAKQDGGGYALFTPADEQPGLGRLALIGELRQAIEQDELVLHYQPLVNVREGTATSVEALVRWEHPTHGLLFPQDFVPLAEQSGLIAALSRWVLTTALTQLRIWSELGLQIPMAVNLSLRNLQDPQLPEEIATLLDGSEHAPLRLRVEIPERMLRSDPTRAMEMLDRLRALGVRVAIDDFGTGHASLLYLRRLLIDELKVDQSFIKNVASDEYDEAIVRSTIQLGHNLGLQVIAEGVEDRTTMTLLDELNCDQAQGYYLSRPLAADELARWWSSRLLEPPAQPETVA